MCGLVGIWNIRKAIELAVVGAHELQHRARTYAGGVSSDGQHMYRHTDENLARQSFTTDILDQLHGKNAMVHLRYPTGKDTPQRENIQPVMGIYDGKPFALGHNGNLTNKDELRALLPEGARMSTDMDTEFIVRLLEQQHGGTIEDDLAKVCSYLEGSYCLLVLAPGRLIAIRDRSGNHPLEIGKLDGGYCVASETCAFPAMGASHLMEVEPGTMVSISRYGARTIRFTQPKERKCVFELLYNSHPASNVFGVGVARFRESVGRELEKLFPIENSVDLIVTPVPDSGNSYAKGFAQSGRSGSDFQVIWRNHYVGRTFNAASQGLRDEEIARKFIFAPSEIRGKRVVVLDDSIVRGSTLPKIVRTLWQEGAREVHVRIGTPPIKHLCTYGIYMDEDATELISAKYSTAEICKKVGATSLEFLPLDALKKLLPDPGTYCYACMDGQYW